MEVKFFRPFQILHLVEKQVYKLELHRKCRIHDVFHMSLLEKNTTKKGQIDENMIELDIDNNDNREYKVEAMWDSTIYTWESESGYLLRLYYLVFWKKYLEEKISRSQPQWSNSSKNSSAHSIKTILISQ